MRAVNKYWALKHEKGRWKIKWQQTMARQLPQRIRSESKILGGREALRKFKLTSHWPGWGRGWMHRSRRHGNTPGHNFNLSSWTRKLKKIHFLFQVALQRYWSCPVQKQKNICFFLRRCRRGFLNILTCCFLNINDSYAVYCCNGYQLKAAVLHKTTS